MEDQCTVEILLRVFIVEDSAPVRERLIELAGEIDGVTIVGSAETPAAAIAGILEARPDCVVLDYQLLGGTGVEVLHAVHAKVPRTVFVVLTNHPNAQYRRRCVEAGASWFLDKSTQFRKIKEIISGLVSAPR